MPLYYIGAFPPSYGGVTVKNSILYKAISERKKIEKVDLNLIKKGSIKEAFRLIHAITGRNNKLVVGISGRKTRKRFCAFLYHLNKRCMRESVLVVMGGTATKDMAADKKYKGYVKEYRKVLVETHGMLEDLMNAGIANGGIYPNCRLRPASFVYSLKDYINSVQDAPLRCVFFSQICDEKGVTTIIDTAKRLPDVEFAFYGSVDASYKEYFFTEEQGQDNVLYKGVFSGRGDEVYRELAKYHILLFPTKWKIEGVPGILVEAKITGLPCIVSNESYNAELIENDIDGFVLEENTEEKLEAAIRKLNSNRSLLYNMSDNSNRSAEYYYVDNNIDTIVNEINS